MKNSCVPFALNTTLPIELKFENVSFYDIYQITHLSKPVVPKFKIRQNFLTQRIFNLSNPWIVSIDHVNC